jgi:alpha-L-fucosidase
MTMNQSWGFTKGDNNWKSPEVLVNQLDEIASKGGNFLLNVGPTAEGEIPAQSVRNLKVVGDWLKINGEAIYGAGSSPLAMESKGTKEPAWRCTIQPGKVYIHLLQWPAGQFTCTGIKNKIAGAYLLADPGKQPLPVRQTGSAVSITLPPRAPGTLINVLCLTLGRRLCGNSDDMLRK